jgi:cell shape-determining protein MreC
MSDELEEFKRNYHNLIVAAKDRELAALRAANEAQAKEIHDLRNKLQEVEGLRAENEKLRKAQA